MSRRRTRPKLTRFEDGEDPTPLRVKVGHFFVWIYGEKPYPTTVECRCQLCGVAAICALPKPLREKQPDGTTHVCHPSFGGCNHGFELVLPAMDNGEAETDVGDSQS